MRGIFAYEFSVVNHERPRIFRVLVTVLFAFALTASLIGVLSIKAMGSTPGDNAMQGTTPAEKPVVIFSASPVSSTPYHLAKNAR